MAQFKRRNNILNLDFDGVLFTVDPTKKEFLNAVNNFRKKADELQGLSDSEDFAESFESALRGLVDCIDEMLGENAAKKIFGESEINLFDCLDVIEYVMDSLQEFNAEKSKKYNIARVAR